MLDPAPDGATAPAKCVYASGAVSVMVAPDTAATVTVSNPVRDQLVADSTSTSPANHTPATDAVSVMDVAPAAAVDASRARTTVRLAPTMDTDPSTVITLLPRNRLLSTSTVGEVRVPCSTISAGLANGVPTVPTSSSPHTVMESACRERAALSLNASLPWIVTAPSLGGFTSMMMYALALMTTSAPATGSVRLGHDAGSDHSVALPSDAGGGGRHSPGPHWMFHTVAMYLP